MAQREMAQRRALRRTHRKGTPQWNDQHRPTPSRHRATPEAHARQDAPPNDGPDATGTAPAHAHQPLNPAQGKEGTPTREEGATATKGAPGKIAAQPTTTPSPPGNDPSRSKGHHTGKGTGTRRGRGRGRDTQG